MSEAKVIDINNDKKISIFREKRIEIPGSLNSKVVIQVGVDQIVGKLKNVSEFGIRAIFDSASIELYANMKLDEIQLYVEDKIIYKGPAKVVNDSAEGKSIAIGLFLQGNPISLDNVKALMMTFDGRDFMVKSQNEFEVSHHVTNQFKVLCADLVHLFTNIKTILSEEESKIEKNYDKKEFYASLIEHATDMGMALYADKIRSLFASFQKEVENYSAEEHLVHKIYFRSIFHPLLLTAPFVKRAFEKPLGYAGDYGLMLMFYEYDNLGESLFDKFIHKYSCNEPSAVANQNRVKFLSSLLVDRLIPKRSKSESVKICSVACGPAMEIRLALEKLDKTKELTQMEIVLIDQEERALDYSQKKIKEIIKKSDKIKCIPLQEDAVLGVIKKANYTRLMDDSDVIVSAGLFDYLSDRVSAKMIERLYDNLKPGGVLIIGNVSNVSPDRFSMNYLMEWNLFLRSPDDLKNLVPVSIVENGAEVNIIQEPLGINLFLTVRKNE